MSKSTATKRRATIKKTRAKSPAEAPVDAPGAPKAPEVPADAPEAPASGKVKAAAAPQAPANTALLDHDDPNAAATHLGVDIVRGPNKLFLVPLAFIEALVPHGFRVVSKG